MEKSKTIKISKQPVNFYITTEDEEILRKHFLNMRFYALISIPDIITSLGKTYETLSEYDEFIVNSTIINQIEIFIKKKQYYSIIYYNPYINYNVIKNLYEYLSDNPNILKIALLDYKYNPKHEDLWQYFEEIVFFPSIKRKKILECEIIKNPMFYIENNLELPEELKKQFKK